MEFQSQLNHIYEMARTIQQTITDIKVEQATNANSPQLPEDEDSQDEADTLNELLEIF